MYDIEDTEDIGLLEWLRISEVILHLVQGPHFPGNYASWFEPYGVQQ
jgi:hypothetical protein